MISRPLIKAVLAKAAFVKAALALFAGLAFAAPAFALNVVWDGRTPEGHREWADRNYVREQMEVLAGKICKALYGNEERSKLHENFTITLYLAPVKGGNPAFASGRRITWKVGEHPGGTPGLGILVHEMTHVLDMGTDGVFTEAMADWVRYYRVCSSPSTVLDKRYSALRGGRHYGKYAKGANFMDFMTQNYGEGTIYRILRGYAKHHGKVWEQLFGKNLDGLVAEWRQMETIYDPVFQWTYNGTAEGKRRWDGKLCGLRAVSAEDADDKSGAWLNGMSAGTVNNLRDGNVTIALHGRFPKKARVAIASLGTVKEGNGKAILIATTSSPDALAAHVVASVPGQGCRVVSTTPIPLPVPSSPLPTSHSVVLSVAGGDAASVVVDGKGAVRVDMKAKCGGCAFAPAFAVGGIAWGFGVNGFTEPSGMDGVMLDDVRVFNRAFRGRETKQYAETFGADYRGGVAVEAHWCGGQGDGAIDDPAKWRCYNSIGEQVVALPTKDTDVFVSGRNLPSIPSKSKFVCKSFTIDGWAVVDEANVDLRGVRIVDVADNSRLITRGGRGIAVHALRANRIRLDGSLAVTGGMKVAGKLEMREGSVLMLPQDAEMARVKSISIRGDGTVALRPCVAPKTGGMQKLLRLDEMPGDLSRFRLNPSDGPNAATFKPSTRGDFLCVSKR